MKITAVYLGGKTSITKEVEISTHNLLYISFGEGEKSIQVDFDPVVADGVQIVGSKPLTIFPNVSNSITVVSKEIQE